MGTLMHCGNPGDAGRAMCLGNCVFHPPVMNNDDLACVAGGPAAVVGRLQRSLAEEVARSGELTEMLTEAMHCLLYVDANMMTERVPVAEKIAKLTGHPWPPYPEAKDDDDDEEDANAY